MLFPNDHFHSKKSSHHTHNIALSGEGAENRCSLRNFVKDCGTKILGGGCEANCFHMEHGITKSPKGHGVERGKGMVVLWPQWNIGCKPILKVLHAYDFGMSREKWREKLFWKKGQQRHNLEMKIMCTIRYFFHYTNPCKYCNNFYFIFL